MLRAQVRGPPVVRRVRDVGGGAPRAQGRRDVVDPDVADGQQRRGRSAPEQLRKQGVEPAGLAGVRVHLVDDVGECQDVERLGDAGGGGVRDQHPAGAAVQRVQEAGQAGRGGDVERPPGQRAPAGLIGRVQDLRGHVRPGDLGDRDVPVGVGRAAGEVVSQFLGELPGQLRPDAAQHLVGVAPHGRVADTDRAVEVENQRGKHSRTIDQREQIVHSSGLHETSVHAAFTGCGRCHDRELGTDDRRTRGPGSRVADHGSWTGRADRPAANVIGIGDAQLRQMRLRVPNR